MFVFVEKTASMPPGYPEGENLWAMGFRLTVDKKAWDFDFFCDNKNQSGIKNAIGFYPTALND